MGYIGKPRRQPPLGRPGSARHLSGAVLHLAATTAISTRSRGSASLASMQARPGRFCPPVHAFQASFMASRRRMSGTQMVALTTLLLSVPHNPSKRSISLRICCVCPFASCLGSSATTPAVNTKPLASTRSEEHTSELQSQSNLVCRLLLEKKKKKKNNYMQSKKNTKNT